MGGGQEEVGRTGAQKPPKRKITTLKASTYANVRPYVDWPAFCETACSATAKCTGIKNVNLKPYSSLLAQPSTTTDTASSIGARAPTE